MRNPLDAKFLKARLLIGLLLLSGLVFAGGPVLKKWTLKDQEREHRDLLRSHEFAPPIIPHPTGRDMQNSSCLHCHEKIRKVSGRIAPLTPHPEWSNCQQCHVNSNVLSWPEKRTGELVEIDSSEKSRRSQPEAPPVIPHSLEMKDNCSTCHQSKSPYTILQFSHPERSNCRQCHVLERGKGQY